MRKVSGSPSGSVTNDETGTAVSSSTCVKPEPAPIWGAWFGEKPRFAKTRWLSAASTWPSPFTSAGAARGAERSRQRGGVETVDDGVAVHIACGAQVEHVRAAPAAADPQRQQAGRGDAVDRRRRSGCRPRDDRLQPLDDRQCRSECGATARRAHSIASRKAPPCGSDDLARAHCEGVQIDPARREHTADRMREVADRGAEIGGDGTCRDRGTVRDRDAASRSGHEREQVARRIGVRVALGGSRLNRLRAPTRLPAASYE